MIFHWGLAAAIRFAGHEKPVDLGQGFRIVAFQNPAILRA